MDFELPEDAPAGWTVVAASGDLDVASSPLLRDQLDRLISAGMGRVIVDLDEVDFIDSTGLGTLVGAAHKARSADGDVRLVCSNTRLLKVISIAGLDDHFAVADAADAVASAPGPVSPGPAASGSGEV